MSDKRKLQFFVLRYVPDAVKSERVNIGVIAIEPGPQGFADARFTRDWRKARCFDPQVDIEMLDAYEREIRERLSTSEGRTMLLAQMEDSFSNLLETSPPLQCLTDNPEKELDLLASQYLETIKATGKKLVSGREEIVQAMRDAFYGAGLHGMIFEKLPVAPYTKVGDPMKFDFGYRVGNAEIKLFHAVSLKTSTRDAEWLAARYPKIQTAMVHLNKADVGLTAVIDDDLDRGRENVQFALSMMEEERIRIAVPAEMPMIAEVARRELRA